MKAEVNFEQIMVAALLKFKCLDPVDIHLLLEELSETDCFEVTACLPIYSFYKYIKISKQGGVVSLQDHLTLDTFLDEQNSTVRDFFLKSTKKSLTHFFDQFDLASFQNRKEKHLEKEKQKLLTTGSILLISDCKEDYEALKQYGFLHIDYFKSAVLADAFFQKHPTQLEKYHIILEGEHSANWLRDCSNLQLGFLIDRVKSDNLTVSSTICSNQSMFSTSFTDYETLRIWNENASSYSEFFDKVVENAFINQVFSKVRIFEDFSSLEPQDVLLLPQPQTKKDLKILYLPYSVKKEHDAIAQKLGLDVTFNKDGNYSLADLFSKLSDYDIIVASDTFSHTLLDMREEVEEQCTKKGRNLSLLVTYDVGHVVQVDEDGITNPLGFGDQVHLNYTFCGKNTTSREFLEQNFRVLRDENEGDLTQAILEASVSLYHEVSFLTDYDLMSPEEYTAIYQKVAQQEKIRKEKALYPLKQLANLKCRLENYLWYKRENLITASLTDLEISEQEEAITITNFHGHRILCKMVLPRNYQNENLIVCSVQSLKDSGVLGEEQLVGFYTRKFAQIEGLPPQPNETQMNVLNSMVKKTRCILDPLNEEAHTKYLEREQAKKLVMNL